MKQHFDYCYKYGKNAEFRFASNHLANISYPTKQQDIYEHWDVRGVCIKISDKHLKFDVKSSARLNHSDTEGIMTEVWVEGTNIVGKDGWIKGKADYIVFEREHTWFVVNREQLFKLTNDKLKENNYKEGKGVYLIHTRYGRKDKVTKVPFKDMKTIEFYEFLKENDYGKGK